MSKISETTTAELRPIIHGALSEWWMTAKRDDGGNLIHTGTEVIDATEAVLSALVERRLERKTESE